MTTKWAHLPNAVHIDRVIASFNSHPSHWNPSAAGLPGVRLAARTEAVDMLKKQGREAGWNAEWALVRSSVRDALLVLGAYDDCAYMLDSDPGELAILAKFGDPRAVLLLPACKVFHVPKEPV